MMKTRRKRQLWKLEVAVVLAGVVMLISLADCNSLKLITFTDIQGHTEPTVVVKKEYSYQEMLKVIKSAKESLWICDIKYEDNLSDEVNPGIVNTILQAEQRGVDVRIMHRETGTLWLNKLRRAGIVNILVPPCESKMVREKSKYVIADKKVVFVQDDKLDHRPRIIRHYSRVRDYIIDFSERWNESERRIRKYGN
ncbi:MAG: hypothetical protein Q7J67_07850 [bacterium]|nr:hypothetical protein [bacterium]